jgi:NAD(P)-dependent dehydrogenase (short-subunit alcohol dehydrogenase family)
MSTSLVIGGSSGIGLATARQLSALGDAVHIAGRSSERLAGAQSRTPALTTHPLDALDGAAVSTLMSSIGGVDRLIITLSGNQGVGSLADLDLKVLREAFEEKFWPVVTALKACVPHLLPTASITLVGAASARSAMPGTAGIGALNAAVEGLIQPLAAELAPIRVNAVSPGYVDTPWWDMVPEPERQSMFEQVAATLPTRRIATADDIAAAIVLLATNPNMTGTIIESDGGGHLTA